MNIPMVTLAAFMAIIPLSSSAGCLLNVLTDHLNGDGKGSTHQAN